MAEDIFVRAATVLVNDAVVDDRLRPNVPLSTVVSKLALAHKMTRERTAPGDAYVETLLSYATAMANKEAADAFFIKMAQKQCCGICLRHVSGVDRELVAPLSCNQFSHGQPAVLSRHCVYACDTCLCYARRWESAFLQQLGKIHPEVLYSKAAADPANKEEEDTCDEEEDTCDEEEDTCDEEEEDQTLQKPQKPQKDTSERVRNYIAFSCLKALMCGTLTQLQANESALSARVTAWAELAYELRRELTNSSSPKLTKVRVLITRLPKDARFTTPAAKARGEMLVWGYAPAAKMSVMVFKSLLVAVTLSPKPTPTDSPAWQECTPDLDFSQLSAVWSHSDLVTWLSKNSSLQPD